MKKSFISVIAAATLITSAGYASSATTLMQIGRSPFHQPPLTDVSSLLNMVEMKNDDIRRGFIKAGLPQLHQPFVEQLATANVVRVDYEKGSHFEWMLFKKKGKGSVRVAKDVTWGSDETFPGYQFDIKDDGMIYTFVVPFGCGNIALMGVRPVSKPVVAPVIPNQAPNCQMSVTPAKAFCGDTVMVDASASNDPDGEIVKTRVEVVFPDGTVDSTQEVDGVSVARVVVPCGTSTIRATVVDNEGEMSAGSMCTTEVTGAKRLVPVVDAGYYHMPDPGNYLFGRFGLQYKFDESWSVLGMVGGAAHIDGIDGVSAFTVDLLGEYAFGSRYFVNMGVGGWISDGDEDLATENSQLDFIAGMGARVYGEPDDFNASLFVEVRAAFEEFDEFIDYGRFGFGVRFKF